MARERRTIRQTTPNHVVIYICLGMVAFFAGLEVWVAIYSYLREWFR